MPVNLTKVILFAIGLLLVGCAHPPITKLSGDTYILTRTDKGGVFGNASAMKTDVLREATDFAEAQGKAVLPISINETPLIVGARFASIEYQFRLVDKDSPALKQAAMVKRADVVIEQTEKKTVDVKTQDITAIKRDTYGELIRLDDLRKRGILSDDEFKVEKQKLLNSH